jgi:hypothetical protein
MLNCGAHNIVMNQRHNFYTWRSSCLESPSDFYREYGKRARRIKVEIHGTSLRFLRLADEDVIKSSIDQHPDFPPPISLPSSSLEDLLTPPSGIATSDAIGPRGIKKDTAEELLSKQGFGSGTTKTTLVEQKVTGVIIEIGKQIRKPTISGSWIAEEDIFRLALPQLEEENKTTTFWYEGGRINWKPYEASS